MSTGGLSKARLHRIHDVMAGHVELGTLSGVVALVNRRGQTHVDAVGAKAFGGDPIRRDTIFRIASMTKPVIAVAALILVEECRLRLDDPVDRFLPELTDRRVLRRIDGPLDDTVPALRPVTVRDLLISRSGFGLLLAPGSAPIREAMHEAGLAPGPNPPASAPREWLRRLADLPLMHQPGEVWMYHTDSDLLGLLLARAADQSLAEFLEERVFAPLGMADTGFHVPSEKLDRLATSYRVHPQTGVLTVDDDPSDSRWARPPVFASGASGLVSTADDYLAFGQMLLAKGRHGSERVLSRPSVELMTSDQLTPEQRTGPHVIFEGNSSWGFGVCVTTRRDSLAATPGRFGWYGGVGTAGYFDPSEDLSGVLLTQLPIDAPGSPDVFSDFWTSAYQAIDD